MVLGTEWLLPRDAAKHIQSSKQPFEADTIIISNLQTDKLRHTVINYPVQDHPTRKWQSRFSWFEPGLSPKPLLLCFTLHYISLFSNCIVNKICTEALVYHLVLLTLLSVGTLVAHLASVQFTPPTNLNMFLFYLQFFMLLKFKHWLKFKFFRLAHKALHALTPDIPLVSHLPIFLNSHLLS